MKEQSNTEAKLSGVELIAKERKRQIDEEGWTLEHDLGHDDGAISLAAACYAAHPLELYTKEEYDTEIHYKQLLPFDKKIDKKKKELRKLIIAGALIAAEIDRLNSKH